MEVKLIIDGEEVILVSAGMSQKRTYNKFKEPEPYGKQGLGESPLIASIYIKPGWKPSQGAGNGKS